ncbi:MAG: hypothetical protein ACFFA0_05175 [Promethearchaeota archaeon]
MIFPPHLKFIVINSISYNLLYELSNKQDIKEKVFLLDQFCENLLYPLILSRQRENITLLLIHEVPFNISTQQNSAFFTNYILGLEA